MVGVSGSKWNQIRSELVEMARLTSLSGEV